MSLPKLPTDPIPRQIKSVAEDRLRSYPVLTITGPRQSGKTTLARLLRPDARYISLEDPDIRTFATEDPRGFLADTGDVAILDEVQRVPELLSYLQGVVDAGNTMGRFILTGSSQFELIESVTQSLAGRTALLTLQPFSLGELQASDRAPSSVAQLLQQGLFPPIHDRPVAAEVWLQDYIATYVERDVRALMNIRDVATFQRFLQLCAGRCGQLLNINSLAEDTGINRATGQSWLSVLQASNLVILVQPWATNLSKRLIKTPKLYFVDSALAASLMVWVLKSNRVPLSRVIISMGWITGVNGLARLRLTHGSFTVVKPGNAGSVDMWCRGTICKHYSERWYRHDDVSG